MDKQRISLSKKLETKADLYDILPDKFELWNGRIELKKSKKAIIKNWRKYPRKDLANWPPNHGTYEIRDSFCPAAFVCPNQNQELQAKAINWGAAISGPCITPDRGVELLVANVVSNPNIRYLILGGKDGGHLSGDVLYCLWKYGIDKNHRVLKTRCPTNPYLRNLPLNLIKRFREQITVINLLDCPDEIAIRLVIRACMQEPEHPLVLTDKKLKVSFSLFDRGSGGKKPLSYNLGLNTKKGIFFEGVHRVGTSIHSPNVAIAWGLLRSHILSVGKVGICESSRRIKDVVGTQIIIHNPEGELVPEEWRPHGWMETDKQVEKWLDSYATWVYLFPFSDVRFNQDKQDIEPYISEKMDYSYGTRLTAWGVERAPLSEQEAIKTAVEKFHQKFIRLSRLPNFKEVVEFYTELGKVQKTSVNSLWRLAQAVKICVDNEITAAYRNYIVLQDPSVDLKPDLRLAHNPCFCLYEAYPRKINKKWQLDVSFFLRANDFVAFPANAAGGINLQKFLAWHSNIKLGIYLHHTGSAHIQDYLL